MLNIIVNIIVNPRSIYWIDCVKTGSMYCVKTDSMYWNKEYKTEKSKLYPPRYKTLVNIHIRTILAYSAKKKNTNTTAECSVINPLTNSDSSNIYVHAKVLLKSKK